MTAYGALDQTGTIDGLKGASIAVANPYVVPLHAAVLDRTDALQLIVLTVTGIDRVDMESAARKGIRVTKCSTTRRKPGPSTPSPSCWPQSGTYHNPMRRYERVSSARRRLTRNIWASSLRAKRSASWGSEGPGRAELVDEDAVYAVLRDGRIAGAALDVIGDRSRSNPLLTLANVVVSPHAAYHSRESRTRCADSVVDTVRTFV